MVGIKVMITGATGMVGEGVLFECLQNDLVEKVLIISRNHYTLAHPKLEELLVPDFLKLAEYKDHLHGFDACFFCAGVSSVGMKEDKYTHLSYDITLAFAKILVDVNPGMVFTYVSGAKTDSTEKSSMMWARVKGKTENDLAALPFKAEYNFRPGIMQPFADQQNWKGYVKVIVKLINFFIPKSVLSLQDLGRAMIHSVTKGYDKNVLEVKDIRKLSKND